MPELSDEAVALAAAGLVQAHATFIAAAATSGDTQVGGPLVADIAAIYREYLSVVRNGGVIHAPLPGSKPDDFDEFA